MSEQYATEINAGRKMVFLVENYDSERYGWVGWYPGLSGPKWGAAALVPMPANETFLGYYATFEAACNAVLAEATPRRKANDLRLQRLHQWIEDRTYRLSDGTEYWNDEVTCDDLDELADIAKGESEADNG